MNVPVSTIEKPLTAIDFIAALETCSSVTDVKNFGELVPMKIRQDERFERAVAQRLAAIKGRRAAA